MLRLLTARSGGLVSFSRLASDLELDDKTVKAHVSMLEELFLVQRLRPWSRNVGSRHVKTPRLFIADTGLMSALAGVDAARYAAIDQGELAGRLLKTDSAGLRFLRDKLGSRFSAGVVLYAGSHTLELEEKIWAVPLPGLWAGDGN